jgi:hypothetical protein
MERTVRYTLFALLALGVHFAIGWLLTPEIFTGGLTESDGYMRLVRVRQLWEGGAWWDGSVPRSNAPYGETLHWTRPFDVWLLIGAAPLALLMPFEQALHAWAVASTPLLLVLAGIGAVWAIRPLVPSGTRYLVMVALLVQPAVMSYALPGRADHHVLVFCAFVWLVGAALRSVAETRSSRSEQAAGLALAAGLWLTVEFLVVWAAILVVLAILWVTGGGDRALRARSVMAWLALGVAVALLVERGLRGFAAVEYDRISIVHLTVALVAVGAWSAVQKLAARGTGGSSPLGRAVEVGLAGAVAGAALAMITPGFFEGPWADLSLEERAYWVDVINELQPVVPTPGRLGVFAAYMGPVFVCVPFVFWRLLREADPSVRAAWLVVATLLVFYVPLGMSSLRFTPFPQILFAMTITALVDCTGAWMARRWQGRTTRVLGTGWALVLLGGFLVVGGVLSPEPEPGQVGPPAPCSMQALARELGDKELYTILAHQDFGQEILYFTPHRVVGTVYHRNVAAVRETHRTMTASEDQVARALVEARDVDLILICPGSKGGYYGKVAPGGGTTFYARLVEGPRPAWLRPRPLALPGTEGLLLFEVVGS